jgi:hypothetical protein
MRPGKGRELKFSELSGAENLRPRKYMNGMVWECGSGCKGN